MSQNLVSAHTFVFNVRRQRFLTVKITTAIARPPLTPTHHEKKGLDAISALTDSHRDQSDMDDSDEHTLTAFGDISPSNRYFIPLSTYSEISPSKRIARRLKAGRPAFPRKTATGKVYTLFSINDRLVIYRMYVTMNQLDPALSAVPHTYQISRDQSYCQVFPVFGPVSQTLSLSQVDQPTSPTCA